MKFQQQVAARRLPDKLFGKQLRAGIAINKWPLSLGLGTGR